jgi:hypothetical protein
MHVHVRTRMHACTHVLSTQSLGDARRAVHVKYAASIKPTVFVEVFRGKSKSVLEHWS